MCWILLTIPDDEDQHCGVDDDVVDHDRPPPPRYDDWRSFNTKIERFVTFEMAVIPKKEVNRLVKIVN